MYVRSEPISHLREVLWFAAVKASADAVKNHERVGIRLLLEAPFAHIAYLTAMLGLDPIEKAIGIVSVVLRHRQDLIRDFQLFSHRLARGGALLTWRKEGGLPEAKRRDQVQIKPILSS